MRPQARAVLFDATGTLIELREPVGATYARVARARGIDASARELDAAFAQSLRRAPAMVFPKAPANEIDALERSWWRSVVAATLRGSGSAGAATPADLEACFEALYHAFAEPRAWRACAGAHEALAALRARAVATGVVSNFDRRLRGILDGLGLGALLDVVVLPSDAAAAKPDPAIFSLALHTLGVEAHEVFFVGDHRERDLDGARRVGMRAIDVRSLATLVELPDCLAAGSRAVEKENR